MDPSRPIRIALVIDRIEARTGGTEGQILQLLDGLDRGRFDPVLFCLRDSEWLRSQADPSLAQLLDISVGLNPRLVAQLWSFGRRLRRERFEIVQTFFRDGNLVGVLAGRLAARPAILSTRRGLPYWSSAPGLWFLRFVDRFVNCFVANSQATRTRYARLEGFAPERCRVIYNGLDPARFRSLGAAQRATKRAELGIPEHAPVVGIVANLRRVKGIDDFLRAAARVREEFPDTRFLVAGEGPQEAELRALATELGLVANLEFLGAREDAPELMQIFDVGVLASHFESFSNSILEYVAAGLPVVATDVGGAAEVLHPGFEGLLVPPRDPEAMAEALRSIIAHPGGARAWRASQDFPEHFEVTSMVRAYEELYLEFCGRSL